jgi:hypothetical protein
MCFQNIFTQNIPVLWLTPLFPVDYTRVIARAASAQLSNIQVATAGLVLRTLEKASVVRTRAAGQATTSRWKASGG